MRRGWLDRLSSDLSAGSAARVQQATWQVFHGVLGLLVFPALPLGLLLSQQGQKVPLWAAAGVVGLAVAFCAGTLWLARRFGAEDPTLSPVARGLGQAVQAAGAAGIPALLALAFLSEPLLALALTAVALGGYWAARRLLSDGGQP